MDVHVFLFSDMLLLCKNLTKVKGDKGNSGSMKIDARTSGRLTNDEVNAMIEQAEKMKLEEELARKASEESSEALPSAQDEKAKTERIRALEIEVEKLKEGTEESQALRKH